MAFGSIGTSHCHPGGGVDNGKPHDARRDLGQIEGEVARQVRSSNSVSLAASGAFTQGVSYARSPFVSSVSQRTDGKLPRRRACLSAFQTMERSSASTFALSNNKQSVNYLERHACRAIRSYSS